MPKSYFVTTAIPYVNAKPHLGHAFEFVFADAVVRYHRSRGEEALLLSGSDENALKNVHAAEKAGMDVWTFIDANTKLFVQLAKQLGVAVDVFQRGGDEKHHHSSQKLWGLCKDAGDIYKKSYEGLYCVGCEAFYTRDELNESGECFEHPGRALEVVSEENYFFRLSKYQDKLYGLISSDTIRVTPESRKNEVLGFLAEPLRDISISRSNERAKNWGVPVPGDDSQRMYVWFDALNIYQSGVGFGWDEARYIKWWPADLHIIGKGIIRFHAVYWPAFLLSAGLPLPRAVFVHGYLTVQGQKMSKTLGNVIGPEEIIGKFGAEASRYLLLATLPNGSDADVDFERLTEKYNADLANGIGNLTARITTLAGGVDGMTLNFDGRENIPVEAFESGYKAEMDNFDFYGAIGKLQNLIRFADSYLSEKKPWGLYGEEKTKVLQNAVAMLYRIAWLINPFMPETAEKIFATLGLQNTSEEWGKVLVVRRGEGVLFPRLD
ncbi:MAG: methionine--tRNA ligase [Candidatus Sungbacteria bacterium]|nr:methionine--tRNA ligase [Candidatus Sungbacteria bacterium]